MIVRMILIGKNLRACRSEMPDAATIIAAPPRNARGQPARCSLSAASVSVFDLFKIGIGPSSSHTMGPMTAAYRFIREVAGAQGMLAQVARVTVGLYGSLALTGKGHATDTAVTLGLAGWLPAHVDPDAAAKLIEEVRQEHGKLTLAGSQSHRVPASIATSTGMYKESLPYPPERADAVRVRRRRTESLHQGTFYSVGGGFVVTEAEAQSPGSVDHGSRNAVPVRERRRAARDRRAREA